MVEQSNDGSQTFHMSLVEPLIFILIPLFGIYLSVMLLLDSPSRNDLFKAILILGVSIFGFVSGSRMPRKLEHIGRDIVISYFGWKRKVNISDIRSYSFDEERSGKRTQYFLAIELNNGMLIKLRNIKGGSRSLMEALEKWTGFKPTVDITDKP